MRKVILAALALLLFAVPSAQAATVPVTSLTPPFAASNSSVTKTPDGVHFGTYANAGAIGGTMFYNGLNGSPLSAVTDFSYTFTYRQANTGPGSGIAAPYLRVFLDADSDGVTDNDVILDPTFCATVDPDQATDLTLQMVGNSVRYSDDSCDGVAPDNQPWEDVVAAHGGEVITGLLVSQGNSGGTDVSALLRNITVNGDTFCFNCDPAPAPGAPGVAGVTTFISVPVANPAIRPVVTTKPNCKGDDKITLHAPRNADARIVSVHALLRGRRLPVAGRTITLDLRNRPEGNYDVTLITRYARHGRIARKVTHRVRSVAC